MTTQPNNEHTAQNPVGRFMVAVGAVILHKKTQKVLISQRSNTLDWHPGEWEITYGRIDQHEDPEDGLKREVKEEMGITDLSVQKILRVWHMYRGSKSVHNDLIGITYLCTTNQEEVTMSDEHEAYAWVTPEEAMKRITVDGIRKDMETYISSI